mmetsp:Transcript_79726/g.215919  ORF Transcript_79726/g.215919 Transcript_79726/m.215919 type:complete len:237 (+) Transcript_79726:197-907(+)
MASSIQPGPRSGCDANPQLIPPDMHWNRVYMVSNNDPYMATTCLYSSLATGARASLMYSVAPCVSTTEIVYMSPTMITRTQKSDWRELMIMCNITRSCVIFRTTRMRRMMRNSRIVLPTLPTRPASPLPAPKARVRAASKRQRPTRKRSNTFHRRSPAYVKKCWRCTARRAMSSTVKTNVQPYSSISKANTSSSETALCCTCAPMSSAFRITTIVIAKSNWLDTTAFPTQPYADTW